MLAQQNEKPKKLSKEELVKIINAQFNVNDEDGYGATATSVMSDGTEKEYAVNAQAKTRSRRRRQRSDKLAQIQQDTPAAAETPAQTTPAAPTEECKAGECCKGGKCKGKGCKMCRGKAWGRKAREGGCRGRWFKNGKCRGKGCRRDNKPKAETPAQETAPTTTTNPTPAL